MGIVAGCDSKPKPQPREVPTYEGEYTNAKGEKVLTVGNNTLSYTDPKTKRKVEAPFSHTEGKLTVESGSTVYTLTFEPPDKIKGFPPNTSEVVTKAK